MARQINTSITWDTLTRVYGQARTMRERGESDENKLKKDILGVLAERGRVLEGGHRYLPTEPIKIGKKWIKGLQRQRRVSQKLDQIKAMAWLHEHGLLEECQVTETTTYLSEDAIIALNFAEKIPDEVFKGFYDETETFALILDEDDEAEDQ